MSHSNKGSFHIFPPPPSVPWASAVYYVEENSGSSCAHLFKCRLILGTVSIGFFYMQVFLMFQTVVNISKICILNHMLSFQITYLGLLKYKAFANVAQFLTLQIHFAKYYILFANKGKYRTRFFRQGFRVKFSLLSFSIMFSSKSITNRDINKSNITHKWLYISFSAKFIKFINIIYHLECSFSLFDIFYHKIPINSKYW